MPQTTFEYLTDLLAGVQLTETDLDQLIADHAKEGLYHDFKSGRSAEKGTKALGQDVRQDLSAFANSEGGFLVYGVTEVPRTVNGFFPPGGKSAENWASDCVAPILPYLSPVPRFSVVPHRDGPVLVIATARAPTYVPCGTKDGQILYYLRLDDKAIPCPPYLLSDLLLGRRRGTVLFVEAANISVALDPAPHGYARFNMQLRVRNEGLVPAEFVRLGAVYYTCMAPHEHPAAPVPDNLKAYIEAEQPRDLGEFALARIGGQQPPINIDPFRESILLDVFGPRLPITGKPVEVCVAVYLLQNGALPLWHQLTFRYGWLTPNTRNIEESSVKALWHDRPRVCCRKGNIVRQNVWGN